MSSAVTLSKPNRNAQPQLVFPAVKDSLSKSGRIDASRESSQLTSLRNGLKSWPSAIFISP